MVVPRSVSHDFSLRVNSPSCLCLTFGVVTLWCHNSDIATGRAKCELCAPWLAFCALEAPLLTYSTILGSCPMIISPLSACFQLKLCFVGDFLDILYDSQKHDWWCQPFNCCASVFEEPEDPTNRSFFSEIISSISDVKFSHNGRYLITRDYLSVKVWDLQMDSKPIETYQVHEYLRSKLCALYENDCIFDKFECSWSGNDRWALQIIFFFHYIC